MRGRMTVCSGLVLAIGAWAVADERPAVRGDAWLGVQLAPVPPPLAAHLQMEGRGLMVQNVFKGSPADAAQLEQYDVIFRVDGEAVSGDIRAFAEHVRSRHPGDRLVLGIYRDGKEAAEQEIALGRTPERDGELDLKFEDPMPDVLRLRDMGLRGRILRPGEGGNWIMEDLGDLPPEKWERFFFDEPARVPLPQGPIMDEGRFVAGDGSSVHVRRKPDGSFKVTRRGKGDGATEEVREYKNLDALRDGDQEAFHLVCPEPARDRPFGADRNFTAPRPGASPERWRQWSERFFQGPMRERGMPGRPDAAAPEAGDPRRAPGGDGGMMRGPKPDGGPAGMGGDPGHRPPPGARPEEGMSRPGPRDGDAREPGPGGSAGRMRGGPGAMKDGEGPAGDRPRDRAPAETNFEVNLDGTITVHVEDEQGSLTRTFKSREDLAKHAPQLFRQLERIESRMR